MKAGEDKLVQRIAKALAFKSGPWPALGIGDDAALLAPHPGYETVLTCDWFLQGSHFLPGKHPADSIGWKCLARAVSDIAAMGGQPTCFLLSLALPDDASLKGASRGNRWLGEFLGGLRRAARRFGCVLAGGDTTQRREILINVTVVGEVRAGRAVKRSGAKVGDRIFVSGTLGEAELGLQKLRRGTRISLRRNDRALRKHLYPEPRLALGQWLADRRLATSMMDVSDGLSSDLPRLCAASQVGARISTAEIPSPKVPLTGTKQRFDALALALNGGDDYELLFTVSQNNVGRMPRSFQGIALTEIGEITRERRIVTVQQDGTPKPLLPRGWDPFRK
ncbi:MAG TPA: thiamine-phosphate kinase [Candidatus Acidoferrum sp.]|nr:thiamine-phosphate kinase [Candidatus Dormibacteraeota bacterium]HXN51872.1 thiamine-phosphate kinase [Candidatus Acidoferrum sp.]